MPGVAGVEDVAGAPGGAGVAGPAGVAGAPEDGGVAGAAGAPEEAGELLPAAEFAAGTGAPGGVFTRSASARSLYSSTKLSISVRLIRVNSSARSM